MKYCAIEPIGREDKDAFLPQLCPVTFFVGLYAFAVFFVLRAGGFDTHDPRQTLRKEVGHFGNGSIIDIADLVLHFPQQPGGENRNGDTGEHDECQRPIGNVHLLERGYRSVDYGDKLDHSRNGSVSTSGILGDPGHQSLSVLIAEVGHGKTENSVPYRMAHIPLGDLSGQFVDAALKSFDQCIQQRESDKTGDEPVLCNSAGHNLAGIGYQPKLGLLNKKGESANQNQHAPGDPNLSVKAEQFFPGEGFIRRSMFLFLFHSCI